MNPFANNIVILTGASTGIGAEIAYLLADQGALLVLAARSADKLEAVAAVCQQRGGKALVVPTDLTDAAQCKQLIERAISEYGRIDTLLYNAGRGHPQRFDQLPDLTDLEFETNLNYLGLVRCTFYALPYLKQTKGRIVGVGSFNAFVGFPNTIGYNGSKHAMRGFMNTLRTELRGTGVTVTMTYPGAIRTDRLEEVMGEKINTVPTMTAKRCAEIIVETAGKRRRQVIMTMAGRLIVWLYRIMPGVVEPIITQVGGVFKDVNQ